MAKSTSKWLSSNRTAKIKHRALAHGSPKHGKTFAALQASKKFPKKLPAAKWTKLDDLLHIPFDDGALDGAMELKLEVPSIDFYGILRETDDLVEALNIVADICYEEAEKNPNLIVISDTVTKLDKLINRYWNDPDNAPKGKDGKIDGYAINREVNGLHMRYHDDMTGLPCHAIFLAHSKPVGESKSVKAKVKAGALPSVGITDVVMDFYYYASGNIYRGDTSIICSVHAIPDRVNPKILNRVAYTEEFQGFEGGCRFQYSLDPQEPADFGHMFAKIDAQLK